MRWRVVFKNELPHLAGRGADQTRVAAVWLHSCLLTKVSLITLHELADSHHLPIATYLWTEGTKSYSQASHLMRPHQYSLLYANTRIRHLRNRYRTFTKKTELFVVPVPGVFCCVSFIRVFFFFSVLLTSPSLFSYPYTYPIHFPSFSCATIHCSLSQLLFLPLLIYCIPVFTYPFYSLQPVTTLPLPLTHSPHAD
jgi:hypothetical protein